DKEAAAPGGQRKRQKCGKRSQKSEFSLETRHVKESRQTHFSSVFVRKWRKRIVADKVLAQPRLCTRLCTESSRTGMALSAPRAAATCARIALASDRLDERARTPWREVRGTPAQLSANLFGDRIDEKTFYRF